MHVSFEIGERKFSIKPYTTKQEKDILLSCTFDAQDFQQIFDILDFKTQYDLTSQEKTIILYKYREISLGDEVSVIFNCNNCRQRSENTINVEASSFILKNSRNDTDIKKLNKEATDENLKEFVDIDCDELEIQEYEILKNRIEQNQISFNFIKNVNCLICGSENAFDVGDLKYICEIMSDDTLKTLYESYNYLIFGNFTKTDVDQMYPFERDIFIGLLEKTRKDLSKD